MTIRLPKPDVFDKILKLLGKKRAVYIPRSVYKEFGPYITIVAKKEPFIKALISSNERRLPEGWVFLSSIINSLESN
jgi:hypothetical protein